MNSISLGSCKQSSKEELKYNLLVRYDKEHDDQVALLKIRRPDGRAITARALSKLEGELLDRVVNKLGSLYNIMEDAGVQNLDRLVMCKQAFTKVKKLPFEKLLEAGFEIGELPPPPDPAVYCTEEYISNALLCGLALDGANIICSDYFGEYGVQAFKALVLELDRMGVTWHVYLDHTLRKWFYQTYNRAGLDLITWLYEERRNCVTTSRKGESADELVLKFAERNGHHIIGRDLYDDEDSDWLRESAAANNPRIHKFYTDGYDIWIPTLGIETTYRYTIAA